MKSATPKQFLLLDGRPVLMHSVERFSTFDPAIRIILVLPAEHHALWRQLCAQHSFALSHSVVAGGEERFHSVKAGLECVTSETGRATEDHGRVNSEIGRADGELGRVKAEPGLTEAENRHVNVEDFSGVLIAIHDGVRPLVSHDTIWRCFSDAEEFGNAVPFIEPADSVRMLEGDDSRPVQRSEVRLIQTPQVFRGSVIIKAYERSFDHSFTDDATVAEADGVKIHLTHGNRENLKITTPEDLAVASTLAAMLRQ